MAANKSVGILTMHRVLNFGSMLQAYALQSVIDELGYKAEIIDYLYPNTEHQQYLQRKSTIKPLTILERIINKILQLPKKKELQNENRRHKNFMLFLNKFLNLSSESYQTRFQLGKDYPKYDIYITGSDQVWNPNYIGYDTSFMLEFVHDGSPEISYAASMSVKEIPDQFADEYRMALSKYSSISVRELESVKIIRQLTGKDAKLVCDPTMLLTKDQWLSKLGLSQNYNEHSDNKYFLVYILDYKYNPYPEIYNIIEQAHRRYGGQIIVLHGKPDAYMKSQGAVCAETAGPIEFVDYFSKASFVVTTSFHGTVFSLNFNVPFVSVLDKTDKDTRLNDLLSYFGAEKFGVKYKDNRIPDTLSFDDCIKQKINQFREESLGFLSSALSKTILGNL